MAAQRRPRSDSAPSTPPAAAPGSSARLAISQSIIARANPNEGAITRADALALVRQLFSVPVTEEEQQKPQPQSFGDKLVDTVDVVTPWIDKLSNLGSEDVKGSWASPSDLALQAMVNALPDEALKPSIIQQLSGAQLAKFVAKTTSDPTVKTFSEDLVARQHAVDDTAIAEYAKSIGVTDPEQLTQQKLKYSTSLDSGELAPSPQSDIAAANLQQTNDASGFAQDVQQGGLLGALSDQTATQQSVLSQVDYQTLFRQYDVGQALQYLNRPNSDGNDNIADGTVLADTATVPFDSTSGQTNTRPNAESFTGAQNNLGAGRLNYTLTEAQNLLYTMSKTELAQMTARLKKAGYFPKSSQSGGSNDGMPIPGDPDDPTLRNAWQTLIGQSFRTGKSMVDVLDEKTGTLVANGTLDVDGNPVNHDRIQLTDQARIRTNADAAASKIIGRYLKPDELDSMVQFIHNLETSNQIDARNTTDASQPFEQADVNAQIDQYIKLMKPPDLNNNDKIDKNEQWTPESLSQFLTYGHKDLAGDSRGTDQAAVDKVTWEQAAASSPSMPTAEPAHAGLTAQRRPI